MPLICPLNNKRVPVAKLGVNAMRKEDALAILSHNALAQDGTSQTRYSRARVEQGTRHCFVAQQLQGV